MTRSLLTTFIVLISYFVYAQIPGIVQPNDILLPNGWHLSPVGKNIALGDLPLNIAVAPNGKYLAVTNNGQSDQSIQLIQASTGKILDTRIINKSWLGLCFTPDSKGLYASGGNDNLVIHYNLINQKLVAADSLVLGEVWPVKISPAGLVIDKTNTILYVVTKEDSALYVINVQRKSIVKKIPLPAEAYTCLISADGQELYVSIWGGKKVAVINTKSLTIKNTIPTGGNPNDLCLDSRRNILFVANANDNTVSVIDVKSEKILETLDAALVPGSPNGSTTNGVALSSDNKTLYIANADNNCVAVFDVSHPGSSFSKGFIPVGWYPTSVRQLNGKLFVTNGKGLLSKANPLGPNPYRKKHPVGYKKSIPVSGVEYIGGLFKGTLSIIDVPSKYQLTEWSKKVYQNCPYNNTKMPQIVDDPRNPIPLKSGLPSPIKYVFYILKENRTYDQVLGDMSNGNGDTSLVLFGRNITPNQHLLADQYVLLDNFYVDGEVSADGHNWSMAAYANDYNEKTWPTSYGGRGGQYDYAGNRPIGLPAGGYIWDDCIKHKVTMRNYGEFDDDGKVFLKDLEQRTCFSFPHWDLNIQDIAREKAWENDFDSLLNNKQIPRFNIVYFGNDHTSGTAGGAYSPFAAVADNDLAVGRFVEHLSQSPIWKESAVFILEDDAQDGADHVDAHRSTAYIVSPYIKHRFTDHHMYSTSSVLRTMELILGLSPMSQYDAAATPIRNCFTSNPDPEPFKALPATYDINERNGKDTSSSAHVKFDLSREDLVPERAFNEVLWKAIKGPASKYPGSKRAAFVASVPKKDD